MQFKSLVLFTIMGLVASTAAMPNPANNQNGKAAAAKAAAAKASAAKASAAKGAASNAKASKTAAAAASKSTAAASSSSAAAASTAGDITTGLPENVQALVDKGQATCKAGATGDVTCTAGTDTFQFTDTGGAGLKPTKF